MKIDKFKNRKFVIWGVIVTVVLIFVIRLFYLQILNENYKQYADNNAFLKKTIYPSRGLIFDRNGELLVFNQNSYDVMIVTKEMENFDTLDFCNILHITKEDFSERMQNIRNRTLNPGYSPYVPQLIVSQISIEEYSVLQEKLFKFPSLYIRNRTLREYAYPYAANVLGFIGEVSKSIVEENPYYISGDYIGINGVEQEYEEYLRGKKGCEVLLRNSRGKVIGKYDDGSFDIESEKGKNLHITLDLALQQYGEELMQNKIGGIVAIEPSTGEILAAISAPSFSPALLVGRKRAQNFEKLKNNPLKPLLDRAFMGRYAPGSTFKTANALILQQEQIITPQTRYGCHMGYNVGKFHLGCHAHTSPLNLPQSIQHSCNAYYCAGFRNMLDHPKYNGIRNAFEIWKNHVVSLGFGYKLGVDIPSENRGYIPNRNVYDKIHGENRWKSLNIVSLAIGQGEVTSTPAQIANLAALIANQGFWISPHFLKTIEGDSAKSFPKNITSIAREYFEPVISGMEMAVNAPSGGTARIAKIEGITVCGKTGTAQNPHGQDHSIFMAFAPKENPKIAIAVLVENAGFGATWAAPIGSLMIEKYLNKEISENRKWLENRILTTTIMPHAKTEY